MPNPTNRSTTRTSTALMQLLTWHRTPPDKQQQAQEYLNAGYAADVDWAEYSAPLPPEEPLPSTLRHAKQCQTKS